MPDFSNETSPTLKIRLPKTEHRQLLGPVVFNATTAQTSDENADGSRLMLEARGLGRCGLNAWLNQTRACENNLVSVLWFQNDKMAAITFLLFCNLVYSDCKFFHGKGSFRHTYQGKGGWDLTCYLCASVVHTINHDRYNSQTLNCCSHLISSYFLVCIPVSRLMLSQTVVQ